MGYCQNCPVWHNENEDTQGDKRMERYEFDVLPKPVRTRTFANETEIITDYFKIRGVGDAYIETVKYPSGRSIYHVHLFDGTDAFKALEVTDYALALTWLRGMWETYYRGMWETYYRGHED
jgi:hypothetical protein